MPLSKDIKKVLVIGSGPIVIGQAAEFDYAGAQACRVLKDAGVDVVLVNSNPATIMTDKALADEIYLEPLTIETIKRIIIKEQPDSILAGLGGQTVGILPAVAKSLPFCCIADRAVFGCFASGFLPGMTKGLPLGLLTQNAGGGGSTGSRRVFMTTAAAGEDRGAQQQSQ